MLVFFAITWRRDDFETRFHDANLHLEPSANLPKVNRFLSIFQAANLPLVSQVTT